ncbi:glycosyltransferase family A protein [Empedobacter falsenii]|uniref:glycosyltransferase family A protein n=1 Tax=Empedobacter falsenii TaxID=343874 RepID=UPI003A80ED2A
MQFTIFTPTYNRKDYLKILYNSLLEQSFKDFEWLIVDDGSSDDTDTEVQNFINEDKLKITYYKQKNGGKHRAINKGLDLAKGEYFFIVDSDDFLPINSLEMVNSKIDLINNKKTVGVIGLRQTLDGKLLGAKFPESDMLLNHIVRSYHLKLKGDYAEVIKTEILKKFKFPDFEGEKFCAEGLIWNRIANAGFNFLCFNEVIYHGEYLDAGLTANSIKNRHKNNQYSSLLYQELSSSKYLNINQKIRANINYWRFVVFTNAKIDSLLKIIVFPYGLMMKFFDKIKIK